VSSQSTNTLPLTWRGSGYGKITDGSAFHAGEETNGRKTQAKARAGPAGRGRQERKAAAVSLVAAHPAQAQLSAPGGDPDPGVTSSRAASHHPGWRGTDVTYLGSFTRTTRDPESEPSRSAHLRWQSIILP
jgi:hypothetical protein